jgi:hypothetical protein
LCLIGVATIVYTNLFSCCVFVSACLIHRFSGYYTIIVFVEAAQRVLI